MGPHSQKVLTLLVPHIWRGEEVTGWGWSCLDLLVAPTCPKHQQCSPSLFLLTFFLGVLSPLVEAGGGLGEENFQPGFAATPFLPRTFPTWQRAGGGQGCNTSFQVSVVG